MRVLILTQYFWPESFRINGFAESLREAGADITVLTGKPNYPDGKVFAGYTAAGVTRERFAGIDVFRVPMVARRRGSAIDLVVNYLSFVLSASIVGAWLLRRRGFDVIFVYAPSPIVQAIPAILLKRIKGARLVTWVQDLWPESLASTGFVRNSAILGAVDQLVRWIYRRHDLLLGQSRAFVAAIQPKSGNTPVEYFPNPGEGAAVSGGATDAPALILPAGFNVVFAGNLGTVQALDTILDAAEMVADRPDVRIVFVGSGSRLEWLKQQVATRKLGNVLIAGRFPAIAMPAIFEQASALLVSLCRGEILSQTIPAKMQTYLAAGRPVLASLDGEGADVVREAGAGLASAAEDAAGLAANIRRLEASSAEDQARMGEAARIFHEAHFRQDILAARLLATFRGLTADNPSQ